MTITIDNPWLTVFVMTMWSWGEVGPVGKLVGVTVTAAGAVGTVALVMAGGGWL